MPPGDPKTLVHEIGWSKSRDEIHLRYKKVGESNYSDTVLDRRGAGWRTESGAAPSRLDFFIRESLNEPPVLVAVDTLKGMSRAIFDPNPLMKDLALGVAKEFEWATASGEKISGGLVLPPNYDPARRYPLVIQTHGFDRQRFFTSGYSDTSNAGRALAGRDMIVLQVKEPGSAKDQTWQDAIDYGLNVYLAAIDRLAADGMVDPTRVGISGFSYSGWLVMTSITRAPTRFAAAVLADSDPVTLTAYYEYVDTPLAKVDADAYVGARPYGEGIKDWVERVPSFSTDKITAPVLFQAADPWHLIAFWDTYAAMRDQGKSVELQFMRGGQHNIRKPLEVFDLDS